MLAILRYFWHLCLLRQGPERIPPSLVLTLFMAVVYLVVEYVSLASNRPDLGFFVSQGVILLGLAIEAFSVFILLTYKGLMPRFTSTLSAIFGCNSILLVVLMPMNYLILALDEGLTLEIVRALSLVCLFWWFAILGFILHRSAEIGLFQGIVMAFAIELIVAAMVRGTFTQFNQAV